MKSSICIVATLMLLALGSVPAFAVKIIYGSGGEIEYPNGTKRTCPTKSESVCARYNNLTSPEATSFEVNDVISLTIEGEDPKNVTVTDVNVAAFNAEGDIDGDEFTYQDEE